MAELKPAEGHCHPAFDIRREEHEGTVLDDNFEVGVKELEY